MSTHVIRLRGPWELSPVPVSPGLSTDAAAEASADFCSVESPQSSRRFHLPGSLRQVLGSGYHGSVQLRRFFHCPSRLDEHERVWLIVESVHALGRVVLNNAHLGNLAGGGQTAQFEITSALRPRNALMVVVHLSPGESGVEGFPERGQPGSPDETLGEIRLEIRRSEHS